MTNKNITAAICGASLLVVSSAQAAWILNQPTGDLTGSAGTWSALPDRTTYDGANAFDGRGFDTAPSAFQVAWTTDGEPISFTLIEDRGPGQGDPIEIDLDPDGDNILPGTITLDVAFNQNVSQRGVVFGALGIGVNAGLGTSLDLASTFLKGDGSLLDVSTVAFTQYGPRNPGDTIATRSGLTATASLSNSSPTDTVLPFGTTNPSEYLVSQSLTLTNFVPSGGPTDPELFRITIDGGVIPEPSSSLLALLGACGLVVRRRR